MTSGALRASRGALRRGRGEHEPSNDRRPLQGDLLSDEAPDRETQDVDTLDVHRVEERDRVRRHRRDRVGGVPAGATYAGIVECDDASPDRERVE